MSEINQKNYLTSNLLFMVLAYAFIIGSIVMAIFDVPFKVSIIVIQYGIILLPILIVMKIKGVSIRDKFRFKRIKLITAVKAILITLAALPIAYALNLIVNLILIKLDLFQVQTLDLGTGTLNYVVIVFLIAVTPGFVEEFFFRGLMFSSYREQMSIRKSIVLTALFFAMFHFNLQNFMLPFFLGLIFGWMVYITDSIYTSMIAHGLFNFIGSIVMYGNQGGSTEEIDAAFEMLDEQTGAILIGLTIICTIFGLILFGLMYWLKSDYVKAEQGDRIKIKDREMQIQSIEEDHLIILHDNVEKKILFKTLKKLSYKILPKMKDYPESNSLNTIFVAMVFILFIGFSLVNYTN